MKSAAGFIKAFKTMTRTILEVQGLCKSYRAPRRWWAGLGSGAQTIPAVDDVSFYIKQGETLGLVGETGCGKTTIGRTILKLTAADAGRIIFDGSDITHLSAARFRPFRSQMQMIFQDLDAALNPKMRIEAILKEALHMRQDRAEGSMDQRIGELLAQVNLKKSKLSNFPSELSGGEKRRVGIARALAVGARFIVADEPTSALDVSIQAQVVNLLKSLQEQLGLSYLFITHDLRIVELISHKVAVMYLGQIVETGLSGRIAHRPHHPYTHSLWSSLVEKQSHEASCLGADACHGAWGIYDFDRPSDGCRFAPRCPVYEQRGRPAICTESESAPRLRDIGDAHKVACHFPLQQQSDEST